MTVRGAGGGGGGGSQRAPVESPDSLVSIAYARIVDLICEGEIFGLVNGAESVFLDGTPLQSNGVPNFGSVTYDTREGTQDQTYIPGFAQVENEISVGAEVTTAIPYTRTITNTDLSALRLNLNVPRMTRQNTENGDLTGATVMYGIDVAIGSGAFSRVKTTSFNGKTTGGYNRSERVDLPPGSPDGWRVRIIRITPDSTTSNLANAFYVASVTEIIDAKFRYPNSALVATQFDAEVFGGKIPVRSFDMWGRYMRVPSNYDTELRTYDGIWDGTFKVAEKCNNPAWVYYDLLLNEFFGLGERISADQVDKWGLYQIAQYCDQMVDDGRGGLEPRFTLNIYVQQRVDALRLLQDISSVFRGITYWGAGQAYVSADMPSDPVYTYTNASVIGGKFSYKGSKYSTRYSVAHVSWNDPSDSYKTKTEYVENQDAVGRFGIRPVSLAAFGCTSQGQAIRAGKWALLTNLLETETVGFSVGLDGIRARPGQVIRVADNDRAGRRIGGRITAATANTVTLDKVGVIAPGDEITIITPSMESETRTIQSINDKVVTVSPDFSAIPMRMSVFAVDSEELATQLFRIISISESGDMNYPIVAVKHVPGKYDNVDFGTVITTRPITSIPTSSQEPVTNLTAVSEYMIDQYAAVSKMTISWDAPPGAVSYDVEWSRDSSDWIYAGRRSTTEIDVQGIFAGSYMVRVKAINAAGVTSIWTQAGPFELEGKDENTAEVVNLRTVPEIFAIRVRWGVPDIARDTAYTELAYNTTNSDVGATTLGQIAYPTLEYLHSGMGAGVSLWFKARLIDKTGNIGPWSSWVMGTSSADATAVLEYLTGEITKTQLADDLLSEIDQIPAMAADIVELQDLAELADIEIGQLQEQIDQIVGAPDWNPSESYLEGSLVKEDGKLYRAIQNVPAGTPVTNTAYWEDIGDYASIGEAVAALAARMGTVEAEIDEVTGELYAQATDITVLRAMNREDGGEGALADALAGWQTQASFAQEVKVRTSQNTALVQVTERLDSEVGNNAAAIQLTQQTLVTLEQSTASQIEALDSVVGDNSAAIQTVQQTIATLDQSTSTQIQSLTSDVGDNAAAIQTTQQTVADLEQSTSTQIQSLTSDAGDNAAAIQTTQQTVADLEQSTSTQIQSLTSDVGDNTAAIQTTQQTVADLEQSTSTQVTTISAINSASREDGGEGELADALRGWDSQASFSQEVKVRAEKDRAQASVNTQLEASVGDAYAAVTQTQQVVAGLNGELSAMLSIKVGVRTDGTYYGAGMGIGVENTPAGMQSQVLFLADRFAILHSVEGDAIAPFVVEGGQTIMNNAIIGEATINFAKISDTLQSDTYVPATTGWRWGKNGTIEINGVAGGIGRTKISNTTYEVFSNTGVRLVRMGVWT